MIVRSAEKPVSKTRSKPRQRSAAVMSPPRRARGQAEFLAQRDRDARGVLHDDELLRVVQGFEHFLDGSSVRVNAPVGQTTTHWPQLMQLDTFSPSSKAVPIFAREPRPMKSMAPTPWISSQTRTHLPQRMHLAGSRTIDGLETSRR